MIETLPACVRDGGIFGLAIPLAVAFVLAFLLLWLTRLVVRELKQRADLNRIRDLVIEGSLGHAILLSDRRRHDEVIAVCRAGIVAVQSTGSVDRAVERIGDEASTRFGGRRFGARFRVAVVVGLVATPAALAVAGRFYYADGVVRAALAEVPEAGRRTFLADAVRDPGVSCPLRLGGLGALGLALPAVAIAMLVLDRRSERTRARAERLAMHYTEMSSRVLSHRAYRDDRERRDRA